MLAGKRVGAVKVPVPLQVERKFEARLGLASRTSAQEEQRVAMGGHLLLSAALGAAYGLLQAALRQPPFPSGPLYGLGLYAVTLAGIGPALKLVPPPREQRPAAVGRQVMMHAVYGVVTALVADRARAAMV
jgi:hypothetical protein